MRAVNLFIFRIILLYSAIFICGTKASRAQVFEFSGKRTKHAISFSLIRNLVIIPVYINGKGPYNFILDTGVGPMIVTDTLISRDLEKKKLRPIKINGLGQGTEIDALLCNEVFAMVGKAGISYIPTAILKEDILGLSNFVGIKISGLLGYHFFSSFIVNINYATKRLIFYTHDAKRKIKGERIPIEIINSKPYAHIDLEIPDLGRLRAKVVLDNGASHALSLEMLNQRTFPVPANSIRANLGIGLGGQISGSLARTSIMKIGSFTFNGVITSYPLYDNAAIKTYLFDRNGNLGADILTRFNITFDYAGSAMFLKRNSAFKRPFEHDMSGIELYVEDTGKPRLFVNRIEPGSPADDSGLKAGDEILNINFTKAGSYTLDEIGRLLKSGDGRNIFFTLNRSGELILKLIKLKKRI